MTDAECAVCGSGTEKRNETYFDETVGEVPTYIRVCLNEKCGHSFMPSHAEVLIDREIRRRLKAENERLRSAMRESYDLMLETRWHDAENELYRALTSAKGMG